jgi:hypothetical protein
MSVGIAAARLDRAWWMGTPVFGPRRRYLFRVALSHARKRKSQPAEGWLFRFKINGLPELDMERVKGIEPSYAAWEAAVLPLNYTRDRAQLYDRCAANPLPG